MHSYQQGTAASIVAAATRVSNSDRATRSSSRYDKNNEIYRRSSTAPTSSNTRTGLPKTKSKEALRSTREDSSKPNALPALRNRSRSRSRANKLAQGSKIG